MYALLLIILALPLAASSLYRVYDCKGAEAACRGLFPGEAHIYNGPYSVNGREVVNGIDLGPSRGPVLGGDPTYLVHYYIHPWVIGWEMCCDADNDGSYVRWFLDGNTATMSRIGGGDGPFFRDINSHGQVVGNVWADSLGVGLFYDTGLMPFGDETKIPEYLLFPDPTIREVMWIPQSMLRINDSAQALFTMQAPAWSDDPSEIRLFLFSPNGAAVPAALHTPEPSSALLLIAGLCLCLRHHHSLRRCLHQRHG